MTGDDAAVYLDCNATTPVEPAVREAVVRYMVDDHGNAGSHSTSMGSAHVLAMQIAREQVARIACARATR